MPGFNPEPSSIQISRMLRRPPAPRVGMTPMIRSPSPMRMGAPHAPRIGRADGGGIVDSPHAPFTGPILTKGLGRSDDVPMHVPPGAYVIPADIVSHVGQGNSIAGLSMLSQMFGAPWGAKGAPWGAQSPPLAKGRGVPIPKGVEPSVSGFPTFQMGYPSYPGVQQGPPRRDAHGGVVPGEGGKAFLGRMGVAGQEPGTPINASGGEFVISPEEVKRRGRGNLDFGHAALDAWVKSVRQHHIKTLKKLPGPAR